MFRTRSKTPAPRGEPPRASGAPLDSATEDRERQDTTAGTTEGQPNALLGRGSEFNGKLNFEGTVRIDGIFTGEISTKDTLVVGEGARVSADISCRSVVVSGEVNGNITASESVELHGPGRVKGDIATPSLMLDKGVVFNGHSKMESAEVNLLIQPHESPTNVEANFSPDLGHN